jgi:hypothetical protein
LHNPTGCYKHLVNIITDKLFRRLLDAVMNKLRQRGIMDKFSLLEESKIMRLKKDVFTVIQLEVIEGLLILDCKRG